MILPSGSAALSIGLDGNALLVVTKDDEVFIRIDGKHGTEPTIVNLGKGQPAFDELKDNIRRLEIFTGD